MFQPSTLASADWEVCFQFTVPSRNSLCGRSRFQCNAFLGMASVPCLQVIFSHRLATTSRIFEVSCMEHSSGCMSPQGRHKPECQFEASIIICFIKSSQRLSEGVTGRAAQDRQMLEDCVLPAPSSIRRFEAGICSFTKVATGRLQSPRSGCVPHTGCSFSSPIFMSFSLSFPNLAYTAPVQ